MNKIFGANYAAVFINKEEKKIKIVWKSFLTTLQYKIVLDLVAEQACKYDIGMIAEDRTKLRFQNSEEIEHWFSSYFVPKISMVKNYFIKEHISSNFKETIQYKNSLTDKELEYKIFSNYQEFESTFLDAY